MITDEKILFDDAFLKEIQDKFYYVHEDYLGRKRQFFENSGGSLRLKAAVEEKARLEKIRRLPRPEPGPVGTGAGAGGPPQAHLRLGQRPRRPPGERTLRPACGRPEPGTWRETGTMNDAFLPGNGFDTYEEQDRVLMGLSGSVRSGVAVRILQQQIYHLPLT